MKKSIITSISLVALAVAGSASAATTQSMNAQIQSLQQQVASMQQQLNQIGSMQANASNSMSGSTSGNSNSGVGQYVQLNTGLTSSMMNNFGGVNREMNILNAKSNLQNTTLYLGGYAEGGLTWNQANRPVYGTYDANTATFSSKSQTQVTLDHVNFDMIGNINQYAAVYIQEDMNSIGQTYGNTSPQFNQVYMLLGNNNLPVYGFIGKKDIDFGSFQTVNMFAQPLDRQLFDVNANTGGVGYNAYGFNVVASVMNGGSNGVNNPNGAGLWNTSNVGPAVLPIAPGLYTPNNAQLNNFALNGSYGMTTAGVNWNVGAGYLNGIWMGQKAGTEAAGGLSATNKRIGAWDVNGQVGFQGLTVLAEFVQTAQSMTFANYNLDGTLLSLGGGNGHVSAWDLGTQYAFNAGLIPNQSVVSFDYSGVKIGATNALNGNQFVLGARNQIFPKANVWAGLEYAYQHATQSNNQPYFSTLNNNILRLDLTANF